jgi:hypothetical protein
MGQFQFRFSNAKFINYALVSMFLLKSIEIFGFLILKITRKKFLSKEWITGEVYRLLEFQDGIRIVLRGHPSSFIGMIVRH